jgi:predicted ATPase/DNA-binding winged helix-turn-helix (wHTH) protein
MQRTYRFENVQVDAAQRTLRVAGQPVAVGGRAFDLLVALVERAGGLVTKDELLVAVWGPLIVEEANLHVHVSALRKLLGPRAIETVPGRGYRFLLPAVDAPAADAPVATEAPAAFAVRVVAPQPLIGREDELHALEALLAAHRLVTVIGAGGIGKTRLAAMATWQARDRHGAGVAVVDLTSLADAALLPVAIATALKLRSPGGDDPVAALVATVRPLDALVLIDNAEHLVDAVAKIAQALVDGAPSLRVLVTSQVPLRVSHERLYRLGGLSVPVAGAAIAAQDALRFGAVALFDERLQAADARARVDDGNIEAVLDICRRLDGIALAIELAAARCPVLGVRGVAQRLGERFRLLRLDSRSGPSRQQTLGATMAWSHGLLTPEQQAAFRQLGVFVGTFTLEMAVEVIAVPGLDAVDAIDLLAELVDRSLVAVDATEPPRYRLLETGRLFALAKLAESGEEPAVRARHVSAMRARFEQACTASWQIDEATFLARYEPDLDNLRAALDHAQATDAVAAVALSSAATRLWRLLSLHPEALQRLQDAADLIDERTPMRLEARLWEGLAEAAVELSHAKCRPAAQRAAELYARLGDDRGRYLALAHYVFTYSGSGGAAEAVDAFAQMQQLEDPDWPASVRGVGRKVEANHALDRGDIDHARVATRERLELGSQCGSRREVNSSLNNLADLALISGDALEAVRMCRLLMARLQPREASTRVVTTGNLLNALLKLGDDAAARVAAGELVDVLRQIDFMFLMYVADGLALLAVREGRLATAGRLVGYTDAAYQAQGQNRELNEAWAHGEVERLLGQACTPAERAAWIAEGATLEPHAICVIALEPPVRSGETNRLQVVEATRRSAP